MIKEVKRYGISGFGGGMIEMEDGAFYHEDDYADLKQEHKAALLQVKAMRELLADWGAHFTGPKVVGGPLSTLRERTDAALQAKL